MFLQVILIIIGFVLLIKGADFLVEGASGIAKKFHIPEIIIGLTIVSIGTSMPELFVSITSAFNGYGDIAIGNVIGSNISNLLLILGLSAAISPILFKKETKLIEIPMCIVITVVFWILCDIGQGISKIDSIILLVMFAIFILYTIYMSKKEKTDSNEIESKENRTILNLVYVILGILSLKFGGDFVVDNCKTIAEIFNISDKIISLTIIALGTSLPELVTSVTASIKGNSDIAVGNVIGSNIFNLLLIPGITGIINEIDFSASYNIQIAILLSATLILGIFLCTGKKDKMTRSDGVIYLLLYILYTVLLFAK